MAASPSSAQNSQGFGSKTFEHQGSAEKRTLRNQGNSDPPSISVYRVQCFLPLPVYDQQKDLHTASFNFGLLCLRPSVCHPLQGATQCNAVSPCWYSVGPIGDCVETTPPEERGEEEKTFIDELKRCLFSNGTSVPSVFHVSRAEDCRNEARTMLNHAARFVTTLMGHHCTHLTPNRRMTEYR